MRAQWNEVLDRRVGCEAKEQPGGLVSNTAMSRCTKMAKPWAIHHRTLHVNCGIRGAQSLFRHQPRPPRRAWDPVLCGHMAQLSVHFPHLVTEAASWMLPADAHISCLSSRSVLALARVPHEATDAVDCDPPREGPRGSRFELFHAQLPSHAVALRPLSRVRFAENKQRPIRTWSPPTVRLLYGEFNSTTSHTHHIPHRDSSYRVWIT